MYEHVCKTILEARKLVHMNVKICQALTMVYFNFHIVNDQVNLQFAILNQGNLKEKEFFL